MSGGARLLRLFAELGNLFPSSSFFQPLITDNTSRPLRFGKFFSNNAVIVSFRRIRLRWFCQGSQSALHFHRIYLLLRRWMSLCFQPLKPVIHFGSRDLRVLLRVLSYGNFSGVFREGPNLYCLPPLAAVLLDAGRADGAAAAVFFPCLRGGGEGLRRAGAAGAAAGLFRPC